jgi:hypothetical protein
MIAAIAATACQQGEPRSPPVDPAYAQDISRICNAEELSGAKEQPEGARQMAVAEWLGPAIETEQAREFLAVLTEFTGAAKAKRLRDEAKRVGLGDCALAASWN